MQVSSRYAVAGWVTLWMLATCAGCWEKIEYKGTPAPPPKAVAKSGVPSSSGEQPAAVPDATIAVTSEPAAPVATGVAATPEAPAADASRLPPTSEQPPPPEDRYATPALPTAAGPESSSAPAAESTGGVAEVSGSGSPNVAAPSAAESSREPLAAAATSPASPSTSPASTVADVGDRYSTPPSVETQAVASAATPSGDATSNSAGGTQPSSTPTVTTSSATTAPEKASSLLTTRRAAWILGSRLALAALAHDRNLAKEKVPIWFNDAQAAAKFLGLTIADLPEPASSGDETVPASRQVVNYLLVNGQRIGPELAKQQGPEAAALFEISLKSNILLLLYTPGGSAAESIAAAISQAAPRAKLPTEFWKPLVDTLISKKPPAEVRAAVRTMHANVDKYLVGPAGQGG